MLKGFTGPILNVFEQRRRQAPDRPTNAFKIRISEILL